MIRSLARAIGRAIPAGLPIGGSDGPVAFSPASLFAGGIEGGWYDLTDLSTLFTGLAGDTPITKCGQRIGKILDKSGNGRHLYQSVLTRQPVYVQGNPSEWTFGSEMVTNGGFAADTDWTKGAGWTISGGVAVATAATSNLSQAMTTVNNTVYKVTITISGFSAGTVQLSFTTSAGSQSVPINGDGTYTVYIQSPGFSNFYIGATGATLNVDDVSVKAVTGYGVAGACMSFASDQGVISSAIAPGANDYVMPCPAYIATGMSLLCAERSNSTGGGYFGVFVDANNRAFLNHNTEAATLMARLNYSSVSRTVPTIPDNTLAVGTNQFVDWQIRPGADGASTINVDGVQVGSVTSTALSTDVTTAAGLSFVPSSAHATNSIYFGGIVVSKALTTQERTDLQDWMTARMNPTVVATGGLVTESGGYRIHTFNTSGDFVALVPLNVEYLVVAGGGGGGRANPGAGGGGGGGVLSGSASIAAATFPVVVGAGGAGGAGLVNDGSIGSSSSFNAVSSSGGGGGQGANVPNINGACGGGGRGFSSSEPGGVGSIGFNGGAGFYNATAALCAGGGGGGMGAAGAAGASAVAGNGGAGISNSISGVAATYAGGGGGGANTGGTAGIGGSGGGGNGAVFATGQTPGAANTGGGGGGVLNTFGAAGGSGIVIIRYLIP